MRECHAHGPISPQTLPDLRSEYGMSIEWGIDTRQEDDPRGEARRFWAEMPPDPPPQG